MSSEPQRPGAPSPLPDAPPPPARGVARRALLLVNEGSRRAPELMETAVAKLRAYEGLEIVLEDCRDPDRLSGIIVAHRETVDMVILGGGDGTMNAAARGLIETGLPLGILPLGTANDLARTLGVPEDLDAAADLILAGRTRRIDCGEVNGRPFFNVASIGISADLAKALTRDLKRRFGRLGYALAAAQVMWRARPFRATIEGAQETARVLTFQVAVGNGRFYGGGMAVDEHATIDDATLHLYSLEMHRPWELFLIAGAFRSGRHGTFRDVRTRAAASFTVTTRKPRSVNADGELITKTPARFRVLPGAVTVFVPETGPGLVGPTRAPNTESA